MTCPLRRDSIFSPDAPAGTSAAGTIHGPKAPVPSKFLPIVHCVLLRW